jgi:hypothetical protein
MSDEASGANLPHLVVAARVSVCKKSTRLPIKGDGPSLVKGIAF